jgi:hypothetical protein
MTTDRFERIGNNLSADFANTIYSPDRADGSLRSAKDVIDFLAVSNALAAREAARVRRALADASDSLWSACLCSSAYSAAVTTDRNFSACARNCCATALTYQRIRRAANERSGAARARHGALTRAAARPAAEMCGRCLRAVFLR